MHAYALRANSTIALIAPPAISSSHPSAQSPAAQKSGGHRAPQKKHEPKTEASTITAIRGEVEKVRGTLQPEVDAFLSSLPAPARARTTSSAGYPQSQSQTQTQRVLGQLTPAQTHTKLSELLLQSLLRLDAMAPEGGWEDARRERKGAVREVQGVLDRLDGEWGARGR